MTPVTPSFPVLKLPFLAVKNVITTMKIFEMIYLAACSNRTGRVIRSVFTKSNNMLAKIHYGVFTMQISGAISFEVAQEYYSPCGLYNLRLQNRFLLQVPNMQLKEWFDLIMFAFRIDNGISIDTWKPYSNFAEILGGREVASLTIDQYPNGFGLRFLDLYMPTKELRLHLSRRPDEEKMPYLRGIITRNFDSIELNFPISLEELLSFTSPTIEIGRLPVTDFNQFLKNWVNGWNPKLKKLEVMLSRNDETKKYLAEYLSGIDIHSFKIEEKGKYKWESFIVQRGDGTTAEVIDTEARFNTQFIVTPKSN